MLRATINGTTLTIDTIYSREEALHVVQLALTAGLTEVQIRHTGEDGLAVDIAPAPVTSAAGPFAAEPLAGLLYVVAEVQKTTPEALINDWRTRRNVPDAARVAAPA
jgi:hypothetical protein